jgi:DNA polymerase elongation subunit (family B)
MGSVYSPFYNIAVAKATTALGRRACVIAKEVVSEGVVGVKPAILCANTDSVTFTVGAKEVGLVMKNWDQINKAIQSRLGSDSYKFELEVAKFSIVSLYGTKVKQVIRVLVDVTKFCEVVAKLKNVEFDAMIANVYKYLTSKTVDDIRAMLKP